MMTRRESRSRIGIVWFDDEAEAEQYARTQLGWYSAEDIADASMGFAWVGRDPGFDRKDEAGNSVEFAVVTP